MVFRASVKGDVVARVNGFVFIRQWGTGVRYKAPEGFTLVYRSDRGLIASVDSDYAVVA